MVVEIETPFHHFLKSAALVFKGLIYSFVKISTSGATVFARLKTPTKVYWVLHIQSDHL